VLFPSRPGAHPGARRFIHDLVPLNTSLGTQAVPSLPLMRDPAFIRVWLGFSTLGPPPHFKAWVSSPFSEPPPAQGHCVPFVGLGQGNVISPFKVPQQSPSPVGGGTNYSVFSEEVIPPRELSPLLIFSIIPRCPGTPIFFCESFPVGSPSGPSSSGR